MMVQHTNTQISSIVPPPPDLLCTERKYVIKDADPTKVVSYSAQRLLCTACTFSTVKQTLVAVPLLTIRMI